MGTVRDGIRPVQSALEVYVQGLRSRLNVQSVVVFGSRARGDHWEDSDIDLLVLSADFEGLPSSQRIDVLLESWSGIPALEPFGLTPAECEGPGWLLLWDALAQGRVLEDDGSFQRAREKFLERVRSGDLTPTADGWRGRLGKGRGDSTTG